MWTRSPLSSEAQVSYKGVELQAAPPQYFYTGLDVLKVEMLNYIHFPLTDSRGSSTSLNPSPKRLKPSTASIIARPGNSIRFGST